MAFGFGNAVSSISNLGWGEGEVWGGDEREAQ